MGMDKELVEFIERDIATYRTETERAAYRAGLSTAAIICDYVKSRTKEANTTRKRLTQIGTALCHVAMHCGDEIMRVRNMIRVRE